MRMLMVFQDVDGLTSDIFGLILSHIYKSSQITTDPALFKSDQPLNSYKKDEKEPQSKFLWQSTYH